MIFVLSARRRSRRGIALIMALFFVSIIAIITVSYVTSMQLDRSSSSSQINGFRAQSMAAAATDCALARLASAVKMDRFWISQPGCISYAPASITGFTPTDVRNIDLHSGSAPSNDDNSSADMNPSTGWMSSRLMATGVASLRVRWIYLRHNGVLESATTSKPAYNRSNPVVGRYAYWVDDEGAKINLNTAWQRPNTGPLGYGSQVNLKAFSDLGNADLVDLKQFREQSYWKAFYSLDEVRRVDEAFSELVTTQKQNLSVWSSSPNWNIFNEPRIILTTQKALAGGGTYLDILKSDGDDPGLLSKLDTTKVNLLVKKIVSILKRTDWPFAPGKSFSAKYAPVRPEQIALNIIDYVRAKESASSVTEPLRGYLSGTGDFVMDVATLNATSGLIGMNRGPRITEFGFIITKISATLYRFKSKIEVHLPEYGGLDSVDLRQLELSYTLTGPPILPFRFKISDTAGDASVVGGDYILAKGQYAVLEASKDVTLTTSISVVTVYMGLVPASGDPYRVEFIPVSGTQLSYTLATTEAALKTKQINDPWMNKNAQNWSAQINPTLGAANTSVSTLGTGTSATPPQDTDNSGKITAVGIRLPAPKSSSNNPNGVMDSVAELGFIHSGNECRNVGTPWRSLRLRKSVDTTTLPDSLLLDMFCVPAVEKSTTATVSYNLQPDAQTRGGTVNINALIGSTAQPFQDSNGTKIYRRNQALNALLKQARNNDDDKSKMLSDNDAATLVASISNTTALPMLDQSYPFYLYPGQLVETAGVADMGESSEALLRAIVDHSAVKSNTFTVFAVGQSIRQTVSGELIVLGEQRTQTIVRWDMNTGTFKPVYTQALKL